MRYVYGVKKIKTLRNRFINISAATVLAFTSLSGALPLFLYERAFAATPANQYVSSATGVDSGNCSSDVNPCKTISYALTQASDGTVMHLAAGTYSEYFTVNHSVTIVGSGSGSTFIQAPANLPTAANNGTIVTIDGSSVSADLSKLTVEGPGPGSCGTIESGIFVEGGAYANLHDMSVNDIADAPLSGCQNGIGIQVGRQSLSTVGTATINNVDISGYQKNGVTVDNTGSFATVKNSTITASGPTNVIAQNGIQVSRGANATIVGDTITGNNYTPTDWSATGILLYGDGGHTVIKNDSVTQNYLGLGLTTPGSLPYINLAGITGNTYDGYAYVDSSWAATPNTTYADASLPAVTADNTDLLVTTQGETHVLGYDAYPAIQAALDNVATNGKVNVADGSYSENLNIAKSGTKISGQSQSGTKLTITGSNSFGQGISVQGQHDVSLTNMTVNVPASSTISYAFQAYQASNLKLTNLSFNGPGATTGKTGGVDVNSSQNVNYTNVTVNGFHKNGFSVTAQYVGSDSPSHNFKFNGVTASNNGWAGIAFYTVNSSGTVGHTISNVSFSGNNSLTNNGQGLFVEGDTDSGHLSHSTPRFTITGNGNQPVDLGTTAFSGNTLDIDNYQTNSLAALDATFDGLTGNQMTADQHTAENAKIIDQRDFNSFGLVNYYNTTVPLSAPTNLMPASGSYTNNNQFDDSWTAVTGAVKYEYHWSAAPTVDSNGSLENIGWDDSGTYDQTTDPGTVIRHNGPTNDGVYYWQVRAFDSEGNPGAWSAVSKITVDTTAPTVPTNGLPNNSIEKTNDFYFTWDASTDATPVTYEFQSTQNPASSNGVLTTGLWKSGTLSDPTIHSTGAADGPWYWQVRAKDAAGNYSAWSTIWKVTIDTATLSAPTLTAPANGAIVNGASVTNTWSSVNNAAKYEYQSFNDAAGTQQRFDGDYTGTSKTATNVADGTVFYWRVRAIDQYGQPGPWSNGGNLWKVTIDNTPPAVPSNVSLKDSTNQPIANGGSTNSYTATVSWTGSADAVHYIYKVWDNISSSTFDGESHAYTTTVSGTSRSGDFNQGEGTYYIEIASVDAAGNVSDFSPVFTVTYDNTAPTVTANDYTGTDRTPTLTGTVSEPSTVTVTVDGQTYTATVATTANTNGTYDWTAQVTNKLQRGSSYTADVSATDPAGNVGTTTANVTVNNTNSSSSSTTTTTNTGSSKTTNNVVVTNFSSQNARTGNANGANAATGNAGNGNTTGTSAVLGDSTTTPSSSNGNGNVKGDSTVKTVQNDSNFLGLGWYWLIVLVAIIGFLYALLRRRSSDANA